MCSLNAQNISIAMLPRFRTFEANQKEICEMVEFWDRTTLSIKRPRTPSERSDEDAHMQHPPSGKKQKGKGKQFCWKEVLCWQYFDSAYKINMILELN